MEKQRPKIGIGVYILNAENQILLMLRKNTTGAGMWCPPGGHLEIGEEFIDTVKRETMEEVGLKVEEAEMWAVNNNIMPDRHYVNLDFFASKWSGEPQNLEPEKCEKIAWFNLNNLPSPLLEPTENFFKHNPKCFCKSGKLFNECHGKK
jgi:8-oxo-dGTP diphosphatase